MQVFWEFFYIALRLWPSASSIQGMNTALFDALDERPFKLKVHQARAHQA